MKINNRTKFANKIIEFFTTKSGIATIIITVVMIYFYFPRYKFDYYYSKDRSQCITLITRTRRFRFGRNLLYLTPGQYSQKRIPDVYISPNIMSDHYWIEEIFFYSKGIFVTGFSAETKNLSEEFKYLRAGGSAIDILKASEYETSLINTTRIALDGYE